MTLAPLIPDDLWIDRFRAKLSGLAPALLEHEVVAAALDTYRQSPSLDPEEAAEIFAQEPPAIDAGEPDH